MKSVCVFVLFIGVCSAAGIDEKYLTKYDNFDVDRVLNNERVLTNYIKCLMDEGSCTNEGRDLKKTIPDALAGGCEKCNEKQRNVTEKVIRHLISKRPKDWDRLSKKYDPQGQYKNKYHDLLDKVSTKDENKKDTKEQPKEQTKKEPKEETKKESKDETKKDPKKETKESAKPKA